MKRWAAIIALTALTILGCQTSAGFDPDPGFDPGLVPDLDDPTDGAGSVEQALTPDPCDGTVPPIQAWLSGDAFPQSTPGTVVVFLRVSSSLWHVFGADPGIGQIIWARSIKPSSIGAFLTLVGNSARAYGGVRGPVNPVCPPDCGLPLLGPYLLAAALRIQSVHSVAQNIAEACVLP